MSKTFYSKMYQPFIIVIYYLSYPLRNSHVSKSPTKTLAFSQISFLYAQRLYAKKTILFGHKISFFSHVINWISLHNLKFWMEVVLYKDFQLRTSWISNYSFRIRLKVFVHSETVWNIICVPDSRLNYQNAQISSFLAAFYCFCCCWNLDGQ